jgi:uncharacterized phage-associated protein
MISPTKYEQTILALLREMGGEVRGKKKLAKLLYFIDFDHFEKFENSVTGEDYFNRQMGPLGINLAKVLRGLERKEKIGITTKQEMAGGYPTECYRLASGDIEISLDESEMDEVRGVVQRYGRLTGRELESIAHDEAPWLATENGEKIPYELAFYRDSEAEA